MREEQLWALCAELEYAAQVAGGLPHHADQDAWGVQPWRVPGRRRRWELIDCDGTVLVAGSAREILRDRDRLIRQVEDYAAELHG